MSTMTVPDTALPVYALSEARRAGYCAALLNDDTECQRRIGHLADGRLHRSTGPYGTGRPVEWDDDGHRRDVCGETAWDGSGGGAYRECLSPPRHEDRPHTAPPVGRLRQRTWWLGDPPGVSER